MSKHKKFYRAIHEVICDDAGVIGIDSDETCTAGRNYPKRILIKPGMVEREVERRERAQSDWDMRECSATLDTENIMANLCQKGLIK